MVGPNSLSVRTLQDISDSVKLKFDWDFFYPNSDFLLTIYRSSIISQEDHYYNCALLSYKTHNSQHDLDNLEYYVFNNMLVYLTKIIEAENGKQDDGGQDSTQRQFSDIQRSASKMMSNAKNQFKMK